MTALDVAVIGAGQAGLAAGHALGQRTGLRYLLLDANERAGGSWPHYYDSLTLFSPARFSALPGLRFPAPPDHYPSRDEMAAYLRLYAEHFRIPVRGRARVTSIESTAEGSFSIHLAGGDDIRARAVIAATGGFGRPHIPRLPGMDEYGGRITHVHDYRNPAPFAGQRILVVGAGNSAIQVAVELADHAAVTIASRTPLRFRSQRPLGVDLHYWISGTGIERLIGRGKTATTPILDDGTYARAIASANPGSRPMFQSFTRDGVIWADGAAERIDAVILATGYEPNLTFLPAAAFDSTHRPEQRRGISTTIPNLGYVGLPGQTNVASATVRGVGRDARYVVRHLAEHLGDGSWTPAMTPVASSTGVWELESS